MSSLIPTSVASFLLSFLVAFMFTRRCTADCGPISLAEDLERAAAIVRLTPANEVFQLACEIEYYDNDKSSYETTNTIPKYKVEEVFKGDSETGTTIPVLYDTDTGYRLVIQGIDSVDGDGFVAFLYETSPMDCDDTFYYVSECSSWNVPWSELSQVERAAIARGISPTSSSGRPKKIFKPYCALDSLWLMVLGIVGGTIVALMAV